MRKFLAILKDSLREAIDAKVFYVMVALSLILTLAAFSLSFEPRPAKEFMETYGVLGLELDSSAVPSDIDDPQVRLLVMLQGAGSSGRSYAVESVEPLPGHKADDPKGKYKVVLRIGYSRDDEFAKVRDNPASVEEKVKKQFGEFVFDVRATEATSAKVIDIGDGKVTETGNGTEEPKKRVDNRFVRVAIETAPTSSTQRLWFHNFSVLFGLVPAVKEKMPLGLLLFFVEDQIVNGIGAWVAIIVSVVLTAFYIPNMLRKGTVDMLLVKPIHRSTLLIYKYIGGLTFIFINTSIVVLGVWLALSIRSGVWSPGFLLSIPIITFFFAILYAASTLFGVLTRSPIAAILMTCGVWLVLFLVGAFKGYFDGEKRKVELQTKTFVRSLPSAQLEIVRQTEAVEAPKAAQAKREAVAAARRAAEKARETHKEPGNLGPKAELDEAVRALNDLKKQMKDTGADAAQVEKVEKLVERQADLASKAGQKYEPGTFERTMRGIHFVLPRTEDLDTLTTDLLLRELLTANQVQLQESQDADGYKQQVTWSESLTVSAVFIALTLALACWRFSSMDY